MLRAVTTRTRAQLLRCAASRSASTAPPGAPKQPVLPPNQPVPDAVTAAAKKNAINALDAGSSSASSGGSGSGVLKMLLIGALSTPAAVAVYLNQNPSWNPEPLRGNEQWLRFRELVLGKDAAAKPAPKAAGEPRPASPKAPAPAKKESAAAEKLRELKEQQQKKTQQEVTAAKPTPEAAPAPAATKAEEVVNAVIAAEKQVEKKGREVVDAVIAAEKQVEQKGRELVDAVIAAEKQVEQKGRELVSAVVAAEKQAEKKGGEVVSAVVAAEQQVAKKVADAAADAKLAVEKKVDEAAQRARAEIDKLAADASPESLGSKMEKKVQATTREILDTLRADSNAAADELDKNYLSGLHELDANALVIRVAQLATEMKHRSKWEATRLLEALRVMEETAQKKSAEVLRLQDELHKELLAKELRLQEELLTRKTREETAQLRKAYAADLARNVNAERAAILNKLQATFQRETKAIEDRYAQELRAKSKELQELLAKERTQRIAEMESYRAQLRALNTVLENSSTYEAFSHQVHKTSVAALALSDRIEAAAPLRDEIRALRDAARSDEFIEVALKTLPTHVIDAGAPSVSQLQERFVVVKKVAHRAALAPADAGLVGQLFGSALSLLMIPPGGPIEGDDTDAVFSRADYALKAGDIESALGELKALSGVPAQVAQDWVAAAESRLAVEQTAKVVKAHVALLAASCS
ncbi:hypothetical protein PybrP1_001433 [[Pythium] brassicae (nom. inval.)]|nr:hypothetical protein PybrP1_001433 [[Pythium] brassicae (nom. inval.)]